jgi:hypothetical protein
MMIIIESKRKMIEKLEHLYPDSEIIDTTSRGVMPWIKLSPFYPHGNIPVPFSEGYYSYSVEGIWQGLKVFRNIDVDVSKFEITSMKGIKRGGKKLGTVIGHRKGVNGKDLLSYLEARRKIYLPTYKWILDNCLNTEITQLKEKFDKKKIVLLDFETNDNLEDINKPLSHAALIRRHIEDKWPS